MCSPFLIENHNAYKKWRGGKLDGLVDTGVITHIKDAENPSREAVGSLKKSCAACNFAIYQFSGGGGRTDILKLASLLGSKNIVKNRHSGTDGITAVRVGNENSRKRYIPYTNRPLNWHTDGYYNDSPHHIASFILHCIEPGAAGGVNRLLDHEIAYILLRDKNPDFITALMDPEAMTIPADRSDKLSVRESVTGPVFAISDHGHLHMRYSARSRFIKWKRNTLLDEARKALTGILQNSGFVVSHRLSAGQGIICNNILHARSAFKNDGARNRLLYRARFSDRVR